MKTVFPVIILMVLLTITYANPGDWLPLNAPGSVYGTYVYGIGGNKIVGSFSDASHNHRGFIYDGITWTFIDKAGADSTSVLDIDGENVVGSYYLGANYYGFLFNNEGWITLSKPGAINTFINGISNNYSVGRYQNSGSLISKNSHGFLYDISSDTWITLDVPGAIETRINGIDGNKIVGQFLDSSGYHGFLYDQNDWITLDVPGATTTGISGISGNNLVGYYVDTSGKKHGALYDGTAWTTLDMPGAEGTSVQDISGKYCVGYGNGGYGFFYEIPEPATVVSIDIKPGSCPNPVNVRSKGVLPVAVLGSEVFDVDDIDPNSLEILGVGPIRYSYEDVTAPVDVNETPEDCLCTTDGPDGYLDMTLKFDTPDIIEAIGEVQDGDYVILTLTGSLKDGTPIEGTDCVMIIKKGKY